MIKRWSMFILLSACVESHSLHCERGGESWLCPEAAICNPARVGCVTADQLASCMGMTDGASCTLQGDLAGVCITEVCELSRCGDGFAMAPEQCDGADLGATPSCRVKGFYDDVPAACSADCTYDYSACTGFCGDGIVNGSELCDQQTPTLSCVDLGYGAGYLECSGQCGPGLADCKILQWTSRVSTQQLFDEHGTDDHDVYAVGNTPIVLHFDGASWSEIDTTPCLGGDPATYLGVFSFGGGNALVAGRDTTTNNSIAVTIAGTTCTRTVIGTNTGQADGVWATGPANVYVVGRGIFHFDGTSWTNTNSNLVLNRVWGTAANNIYAVGASGVWHFDGMTWTNVTVTSTIVYDIAGSSASDIYIAGDQGIEHWNGSAWSAVQAPPSSPLSVAVAGGRLICGTYAGAFVYNGAFVASNTAWTNLAAPTADQVIAGMWAAPNGTLFAHNYTRELHYRGSSFNVEVGTLPGFPVKLVAINPNTALLLDDTGFYLVDGFHTPTAITGSPYAVSSYEDMWRSPTGTVFFIQYSASPGGALVTYAPGTWDIPAGLPRGTNSVWGTSDTDVWLLTEFGTNLTHFDGVNIDAFPCATCAPGPVFESMWGPTSTNVYAVGSAGAIYHWNGSDWSAQTSGTSQTLSAIWGVGANDIVAIGAGVALHFDGSAWTAIEAPPGVPKSRAIWGGSTSDVFVSTQYGLFHFDGAHWSPVRTGVAADVDVLDGAGDVMFMFDGTDDSLRLVRTIPW